MDEDGDYDVVGLAATWPYLTKHFLSEDTIVPAMVIYKNSRINNDCVADLTSLDQAWHEPFYAVPDGIVTGIDIQYYVNLWIAGCP